MVVHPKNPIFYILRSFSLVFFLIPIPFLVFSIFLNLPLLHKRQPLNVQISTLSAFLTLWATCKRPCGALGGFTVRTVYLDSSDTCVGIGTFQFCLDLQFLVYVSSIADRFSVTEILIWAPLTGSAQMVSSCLSSFWRWKARLWANYAWFEDQNSIYESSTQSISLYCAQPYFSVCYSSWFIINLSSYITLWAWFLRIRGEWLRQMIELGWINTMVLL